MSYVLSDNYEFGLKQVCNNRNNRKNTILWKLNNSLLKGIKKEINFLCNLKQITANIIVNREKAQIICIKIRNKIRISTILAPVQHYS